MLDETLQNLKRGKTILLFRLQAPGPDLYKLTRILRSIEMPQHIPEILPYPAENLTV